MKASTGMTVTVKRLGKVTAIETIENVALIVPNYSTPFRELVSYTLYNSISGSCVSVIEKLPAFMLQKIEYC